MLEAAFSGLAEGERRALARLLEKLVATLSPAAAPEAARRKS
jgi:hypothetical protein